MSRVQPILNCLKQSKSKIFLMALILCQQELKLKFLYQELIDPKKPKRPHIYQTTFYFSFSHLKKCQYIYLFYLESLKFFFHLLIYLSNTKAKIPLSFQINPKKLKYKNLIFVDKQKNLPMALLFPEGLEVLCFLKTQPNKL